MGHNQNVPTLEPLGKVSEQDHNLIKTREGVCVCVCMYMWRPEGFGTSLHQWCILLAPVRGAPQGERRSPKTLSFEKDGGMNRPLNLP